MIIKHSELSNVRKKYHDKTIVAGSGVFDLLHRGHISYLQSLQNYGYIVVVIVKPDDRIRTYKHKNRPIIPEQDRVHMVDAIKGVDYALVGLHDNSNESYSMYKEMFRVLRPDIFVSSNDVWGKLDRITDAEVRILPRNKVGYYDSTTAIIQHINKLDSF